jgi:hypothetical protein
MEMKWTIISDKRIFKFMGHIYEPFLQNINFMKFRCMYFSSQKHALSSWSLVHIHLLTYFYSGLFLYFFWGGGGGGWGVFKLKY